MMIIENSVNYIKTTSDRKWSANTLRRIAMDGSGKNIVLSMALVYSKDVC
jgi:hypothetical protein